MFTALPAIAVLAALGAVLAFTHHASVVKDRRDEMRSLANAAASNAQRFVSDRLATLGTAAAAPFVRRGDLPRIREYLPSVRKIGDFTSGVAFADTNLDVQAFSPGGALPIPTSIADRAYAQKALRAKNTAISEVLISRGTRRPVLVLAYPVESEPGVLTGIFTGSIRLDQLSDAVKRLLYAPSADETIIDPAGNVIVGSARIQGVQPAPSWIDVRALRARETGSVKAVDAPDGKKLVGFSYLSQLGWLVVVDRPYDDVIGPLDTALAAELVALVLLALVGVMITFSAARKLDVMDEARDAALDEQRTIALRLQRSLLPDVEPGPSVDVHARYAPAQGAMSVGGDWYDVVELDDGRLAMSMGDVAGHGLSAAAAMGQLRSATRMLALGRHEPADALERLDRFAMTLDGRPLATVVFGILDPDTGRLRYACAGHPPPLLVLADGRTRYLEDGRSPLLGVEPVAMRPVGAVTMQPGDTLVLYTDGLVERPDRSIDDGLTDLAQQAAAVSHDPAVLAKALLDGVSEPRRDDAAVLCIRLAPQPERQPSSVPS